MSVTSMPEIRVASLRLGVMTSIRDRSPAPRGPCRRLSITGTRRGSHLGGILHLAMGTSSRISTTSARRISSAARSMSSRPRAILAPEATTIEFFALGIDRYERYARHAVAIHAHARVSMPSRRIDSRVCRPNISSPDTRHEDHMLAIPRRGHGLIGPLPPGVHHELAAENRLPRRRRCDVFTTMSVLLLPITTMFFISTRFISQRYPFFRRKKTARALI